MPRPFFFSYAHIDDQIHNPDPIMDAFFTEVNSRIQRLTGTAEDGFRDRDVLRAGDQWSQNVVNELGESRALVCMYSPAFFKSKVCSREMQVFLERREKYMELNEGNPPAHIIPVLWQPCDAVPRALPWDLQYEKPRTLDPAKDGVWRVLDCELNREFKQIAHAVAVRVKEALKTTLPPLGYQPVLGGLASAFDPLPLPPKEFDEPGAAAGLQCATFVYWRPPEWRAWPFAAVENDLRLLHISAAVARGRDLKAHQLTFDPAVTGVKKRLEFARQKKNLVVLLVDGTTLSNPALLSHLREVDDQAPPDLSTVVVWPSGAPSATWEDTARRAFPKLGVRQPPYFYPAINDPERFAAAVAQSLDTLKNDARNQSGGVEPLPPSSPVGGGPCYPIIPAVSGPGERKGS